MYLLSVHKHTFIFITYMMIEKVYCRKYCISSIVIPVDNVINLIVCHVSYFIEFCSSNKLIFSHNSSNLFFCNLISSACFLTRFFEDQFHQLVVS